ncbi:Polyprotein [Acanthamoeba castellanii str. Neff]|uniref:Polyprotein n=1 Tax=Acanthamoeba castellanii (strain ATCC 30010 / Neff) TaxID=1257118 RepID=L8GIS6_ACACF|nr:Polyprotein [Acanthamoeba castellanii str. Neff]ELR12638.1 Polyprotein [Acanthamoeba castellanii str. Neff]
MADKKKDKVKAAPDGEAKKIILDYMKTQNRPFNAVMLFENLHGVVKKTQAVKLMADLAAAGKVVEKLKGKQKIYWATQEGLVIADAKGLAKLDKEIESLRTEKKSIAGELGEIGSRISSLNNALTNEEADAEIEKLTKENAELETKLTRLRGGAKLVSKADKDKAEKQYEHVRCMDVVKQVGEGAGKKDKEIMEEVELEGDDDAGVDLTAETRTAKRRKIGD